MVLAAPSAAGQTADSAVVRGEVVAEQGGERLAGAQVLLDDRVVAASGAGGAFAFSVPAGSYILTVRHIGFLPEVARLTLERGADLELVVQLRTGPVVLDTVEIVGRARGRKLDLSGFYERREHGLGQFMERDEIERRHASRLSDVFRAFRGLDVSCRFGGCFLRVTRFAAGAGRAACRIRYYVDGLPWEPAASGIDEMPVEWIEGIEVYLGAQQSPPQYARGERCGVIVMWTRDPSRS